jgi:hypothetical protein
MAARLAALGIAAAAIDLGGVYMKAPAGPAGVTLGDWIAGLGAYLLLALYAWIASGLGVRRGPQARLFLAAIITYAAGTGIHLAANSIHDMLDKTGGSDPWKLAYFWDETAGHYMVDAARIGFAISLAWIEAGTPRGAIASSAPAPGGRLPILAGAVSYGFIYFATAVEGQTVPLALPFVILFAAWGVWRSRAESGQPPAPVRGFFTAAALVSLSLFAVWGAWHGGFPEFSRTGFIP